MSDDTTSNLDIKELAEKVQQFLSHQIEINSELSEAAKESLTVATECIEQAYNIQRKPASKDLLNIYRASKFRPFQQQQAGSTNSQPAGPGAPNAADPAQIITNLASTLLSQVGPNLVNSVANAAASAAAAAAATGQQQNAGTSATSSSTNISSEPTTPQASAPPKVRKTATPSELLAAESFKNQGNECMKQEKFKEAHDYYTQAIEIDNNNAIYYSNRAAASAKLGNHQAALSDCLESIEIDPNYSKAYGRMGLAYASMDNHRKAKEAYVKAVELDPHNESYSNNLAIAEEKLAEAQAGASFAAGFPAGSEAGGAASAPNMVTNMLRSMMNDPNVMSMAMRSLQDPRLQSMFGLGGGGGGGAPGSGGATGGGSAGAH